MSETTPGVVPERMPDISYEEHPIYAAPRGDIRLKQRPFALARVVQTASYV